MSASEPVYLMAAVDAAATELGRRLRATGGKVVTVESCTGGLIAKALTEAAGSSHWFDRGLVTYSNESKVQLAGVLPATLAEHGAVSEEVAREMADGGLALGAAPSASPGAPAGGDA
ncbi:MAG TPA: nicotinamide-nucleotide amidohydrolase family protein, partial [Burkholderiaceae bacterium]